MTQLLTPDEAARVLSVSRKRIYEMSCAREIDTVHVGRSLRIPADAVESYLARRRRKAIR